MKSYEIKSEGSGKISAALAKMCAMGAIGEPLVRSGVTQDAFCLFLARLAKRHIEAGKTDDEVAAVLLLVSGGNASAARQALGACSLIWEGDSKPQSVMAYWQRSGGSKAAPNLAALDL